jgi:hypothetical protein
MPSFLPNTKPRPLNIYSFPSSNVQMDPKFLRNQRYCKKHNKIAE